MNGKSPQGRMPPKASRYDSFRTSIWKRWRCTARSRRKCRNTIEDSRYLGKYYVHNCHPAIIDRVTFQKVQEEIARRVGKRKTSSKAKTELGKYSGKYALSELMTCGECGSPYRRQTYMPHGEKIYVWRCLNRMENGRRICKCSPTFAEQDIHDAVVAAMNEMLSQNKSRKS